MKPIQLIIAYSFDKKITYNKNDITLGLYHKFFYQNEIIYAITDMKLIYFTNYIINNIDIIHFIYKDYLFLIFNKYINQNWDMTVFLEKQEYLLNEVNQYFKSLNINKYITEINAKLLLEQL